MKKYILMLVASLFMFSAQAQKFGYVDSEYILKKIPAYKSAQDQLERMTKQNEQEVEAKYKEVDDLFKKYQSEKVLLTDDMRQKREADIVAKEREVKEMQKKYFSPEGTVAKKRDELLKPIQDRVFTAVKELATDGGYATIFDVSNNPGIIYNNPRFDLSDKILEKMGHKN